MRLVISCVVRKDITKILIDLTRKLTGEIGPLFVDQSYGPIDHVSIAVVSTSDDLAENLQSSKRVNQSGSFVHPMTKEKVRHFDIGIPFPPIEVLSLDAVTLTSRICSKIIEGLYASQDRKMPSDFEYRKFIDRLIPVLEKYVVTG